LEIALAGMASSTPDPKGPKMNCTLVFQKDEKGAHYGFVMNSANSANIIPSFF
jgi:hypothetical protein